MSGDAENSLHRMDFLNCQLRFSNCTLSGMNSNYARYSSTRGPLDEMYESQELFNEGILSFEYPLYHATDEELDNFLGKVFHSVRRTVSRAASDAAKVGTSALKTVGKVVNTVQKVIPAPILTSTLSWTPMGMAVRAGLGAASATADGKNAFQGALRSLARDPVSKIFVDSAIAGAQGKNILKAAEQATKAGISDLRESLRFASMVASFVPGVGTGVAAALAAANALASGEKITDALIAAARNAIPGGAIAQVGFDMAVNLAKGRNLGDAALMAARSRLPGGAAAQAAFDAGLSLAKGKSIQDAAFAAAGRVLPKSPYSADALAFVRKVVNGENIQRAALSGAGNLVLKRIERQMGPSPGSIAQRGVPRQVTRTGIRLSLYKR
jgi:hypothetical protein